jgi:hypothetical protein
VKRSLVLQHPEAHDEKGSRARTFSTGWSLEDCIHFARGAAIIIALYLIHPAVGGVSLAQIKSRVGSWVVIDLSRFFLLTSCDLGPKLNCFI